MAREYLEPALHRRQKALYYLEKLYLETPGLSREQNEALAHALAVVRLDTQDWAEHRDKCDSTILDWEPPNA